MLLTLFLGARVRGRFVVLGALATWATANAGPRLKGAVVPRAAFFVAKLGTGNFVPAYP